MDSDSHTDSSLSVRGRRNPETCHGPESGGLSSSGKNAMTTFTYHENRISHRSELGL